MYDIVDGLNSFTELQAFFSKLNANWIFRGQQNYDWDLSTTIDRLEMIQPLKAPVTKKDIEKLMIQQVQRDIHMYSQSTKELLIDDVHIISFLQHYGAPTRFLDFTTSYLAALFFALENASGDASVYAIDKHFISISNRMIWEPLKFEDKVPENRFYFKDARRDGHLFVGRIPDILKEYNYNFSDPAIFEYLVKSFPLPPDFISTINPYHSFQRMTSQSGLFLYQGNADKSFSVNLKNNIDNYPKIQNQKIIYKIRIPYLLKSDILSRLYRLNISSASLYPGMEGFAKSLALKAMVNIYDASKDSL
jgi:hypothetical protein